MIELRELIARRALSIAAPSERKRFRRRWRASALLLAAASALNCKPLPPARPIATPTPVSQTPTVTAETPPPTPVETVPADVVEPSPAPAGSAPIVVTPNLIIPVAGVRPEDLQDTFSDARSENRVHNAIDIMAAAGTAVLAAADGHIVKLLESERGGITLYQVGADENITYYYAHLERYAENLAEGQVVKQGDVIGYVGDTGNAGAGNYHLHFAVWITADPKRYWEGENINPYPLLKR